MHFVTLCYPCSLAVPLACLCHTFLFFLPFHIASLFCPEGDIRPQQPTGDLPLFTLHIFGETDVKLWPSFRCEQLISVPVRDSISSSAAAAAGGWGWGGLWWLGGGLLLLYSPCSVCSSSLSSSSISPLSSFLPPAQFSQPPFTVSFHFSTSLLPSDSAWNCDVSSCRRRPSPLSRQQEGEEGLSGALKEKDSCLSHPVLSLLLLLLLSSVLPCSWQGFDVSHYPLVGH